LPRRRRQRLDREAESARRAAAAEARHREHEEQEEAIARRDESVPAPRRTTGRRLSKNGWGGRDEEIGPPTSSVRYVLRRAQAPMERSLAQKR
jgi:hypothetical protein